MSEEGFGITLDCVHLSKPKTIQKIKQMNTPKETFKNACAILSLVWSVGKIQDVVKASFEA